MRMSVRTNALAKLRARYNRRGEAESAIERRLSKSTAGRFPLCGSYAGLVFVDNALEPLIPDQLGK